LPHGEPIPGRRSLPRPGAAQDCPPIHEDGITTLEFNALVDVLQSAMAREGVVLPAQSRLFAKLAPMKREAVIRWSVSWGSQQWWVTRPIDVSPDQPEQLKSLHSWR
jgi:hypothetical protein